MSAEEGDVEGPVKFVAIINLYRANGKLQLSVHIVTERDESVMHIIYTNQRTLLE